MEELAQAMGKDIGESLPWGLEQQNLSQPLPSPVGKAEMSSVPLVMDPSLGKMSELNPVSKNSCLKSFGPKSRVGIWDSAAIRVSLEQAFD